MLSASIVVILYIQQQHKRLIGVFLAPSVIKSQYTCTVSVFSASVFAEANMLLSIMLIIHLCLYGVGCVEWIYWAFLFIYLYAGNCCLLLETAWIGLKQKCIGL